MSDSVVCSELYKKANIVLSNENEDTKSFVMIIVEEKGKYQDCERFYYNEIMNFKKCALWILMTCLVHAI